MPKISFHSLATSAAVAGLLALYGGAAAQEPSEPRGQAEDRAQAPAQGAAESRPAPARPALPHITGTVLRWTGSRIDLKTDKGETRKIAVNSATEQSVKLEPGAEVRVEYRRKVGDFVIAERVLPAGEEKAAAAARPAPEQTLVTGSLVSWTDAAMIVKTGSGDVTLFLGPPTEYEVQALKAGMPVAVEYQEVSGQAKLALRVRAAAPASRPEQPQR